MNIEEIREERDQLVADITRLLQNFSGKTHLGVEGICGHCWVDGNGEPYELNVEVILEKI